MRGITPNEWDIVSRGWPEMMAQALEDADARIAELEAEVAAWERTDHYVSAVEAKANERIATLEAEKKELARDAGQSMLTADDLDARLVTATAHIATLEALLREIKEGWRGPRYQDPDQLVVRIDAALAEPNGE